MPERKVACVFDKKHVMPEGAIKKHQLMCFIKHRNTHRSCPWHAEHYVKREEYDEHMINCDRRQEGLRFQAGMDGCFKNGERLSTIPLGNLAKNWDKWGGKYKESKERIRNYAPPPIPEVVHEVETEQNYSYLHWAKGMSISEKKEYAKIGAQNYVRMFSNTLV